MSKNNILIYLDYNKTLFSELTDEEIGKVLRAILKYAETGEKTTFEDRLIHTVYARMLSDFENDKKKYEEICEKRRQAALKRKSDSSNCMQMDANATHNENDNDNPIVNVNLNGNDNPNPNHKTGRGEDSIPDLFGGIE